MKRLLKKMILMPFLAGVMVLLAVPSFFSMEGTGKVQAADFTVCDENTQIGDYYIWKDENVIWIADANHENEEIVEEADDGYTIGLNLISDGKTIYYFQQKIIGNGYAGAIYSDIFYKYTIAKKTTKIVGTMKNAAAIYRFYKGSLYVNCWDEEDCEAVHVYRLNTKTKKASVVMKNVSVDYQSGDYLVLSPNSGAYCELPLYTYNCKTKKKYTITKKSLGAAIVGKKLYFAEMKSYSSGKYTCKVYKCSLNGKNKKAITKTITASAIMKIKKNYMVFYEWTGSESKYYQYFFKTGKKKSITQAQSSELCK